MPIRGNPSNPPITTAFPSINTDPPPYTQTANVLLQQTLEYFSSNNLPNSTPKQTPFRFPISPFISNNNNNNNNSNCNNIDSFSPSFYTPLHTVINDEDDERISTDSSVHYMFNTFLNHPVYNNKDTEYNRKYYQYLHMQTSNNPDLKTSRNVFDSTAINVPVQTIDINITAPFKTAVSAVADLGSDIECIGKRIADRYETHIYSDPEGRNIRTGNGIITVYEYILTDITYKNRIYKAKFWCLPELPYDYLIGRNLIHLLGYKLTNQSAPYIHHPTDPDDGSEELDMLDCSRYPVNPEPIINYNDINISNDAIKSDVVSLLHEYDEIVAKGEWDRGIIDDIEFTIDWKEGADITPWRMVEYPLRPDIKPEVTRQILKMKEVGLTRLSIPGSAYVSPVFAVSDINQLLASFKDNEIFTSLDMKGGYWHIPIFEPDKYKTAFIYDGIIYEWNFMPFGPTNAPAFFQMVMNKLFGHLPFVTVYIDDISIHSKNVAEHIEHLRAVFDIIKQNKIKLRIDKCVFGASETISTK